MMDNKTLEVFIWPLFKIDPRVISISQFLGKINNNKEFFIKKDFCIIKIDLPKFAKTFVHILKTPKSYIKFLDLKDKNSKNKEGNNEKKDDYSTRINDFKNILDNLKNTDDYFFKKKKNDDNINQIEKERYRSKSFGKHSLVDEEEIILKYQLHSAKDNSNVEYILIKK